LLGHEEKYAYAVGRTRAVETKLLDRASIERMIDASDVSGAFKVLEEAGYIQVAACAKDLLSIDEVLDQEELKLLQFIEETSPDKRLSRLITLRHDYHNLKVLLKANIFNVSPVMAMSRLGTLSEDAICKAINGETRELPAEFRSALKKVRALYSQRSSPEVIDIVIDRAMHEALLDLAQTVGIQFLIRYVKTEIDFLNLLIFLRARKMRRDTWLVEHALVAGGNIDHRRLSQAYEDESQDALMDVLSGTGYEFVARRGLNLLEEGGSLSEIEGFLEEIISGLIREARYVPLGPEPLIGYILAKQQELRIARLVIAGKAAGVAGDSIRERLRDVYV
jgi:V/A-type H+-transporting ATPase subunit C